MGILVVDNNDCFCRNLIISLKTIEDSVLLAHDPGKALFLISKFKPDKVVLEQHLDNANGFDMIKPILNIDDAIQIIVLSRYGSIADSVKAVKLGAFNYLPKPITAQALVQAFGSSANVANDDLAKGKKPMSIKRFEWEYINTVLANQQGNISATARELGLDRRTLQRKLKKYPCLD